MFGYSDWDNRRFTCTATLDQSPKGEGGIRGELSYTITCHQSGKASPKEAHHTRYIQAMPSISISHSLLTSFNLQALSAMRSPVLVISVRWVDRHRVDCRKARSESQKANRSVVLARNENSTEQSAANATSTNNNLSFLETHNSNHNKTSLFLLFYFITQPFSPKFCWIIDLIFLDSNQWTVYEFFVIWIDFNFMVFPFDLIKLNFSWCDSSFHLNFILFPRFIQVVPKNQVYVFFI